MARPARTATDSLLSNLSSDVDEELADAEASTNETGDRLIIAIDFGTTFSSVAFCKLNENTPRDSLGLEEVQCIAHYPDDGPPEGVLSRDYTSRQDVPTELWYGLPQSLSQFHPSDQRIQSNMRPVVNDCSGVSDTSSNSSSSEDEDEPIMPQVLTEGGCTFWGFGVQKQLKDVDIPKDGVGRLASFKLVLDKRPETEDIRDKLGPKLRKLRRSNVLNRGTRLAKTKWARATDWSNQEIISDYLEQLLRHTKAELHKKNIFTVNMPIEFVLCVPAVWPHKALWTMQSALGTAVQRCELGTSLDSVFIVSEPEAAAACVLAEDHNDIYENETIIVFDAGGGTMDAVTYQITSSQPPRLSKEVIPPGTRLRGGSFINEYFRDLLMERLKNEKCLEKNGKTIKSIVDGKVILFENGEKRTINTKTDKFDRIVYIDDLRPSAEKGFLQNRLVIRSKEIKKVFKRSLNGARELLEEQLERARKAGYSVQKVILIGGFGQSPSLQSMLQKVLASTTNLHGHKIQLLIPDTPSTVVARGAVLQACNKEHNPDRISMCSYGLLRSEPYNPENPAHNAQKWRIDEADGERYIDKTIKWFIKKGKALPHQWEKSFTLRHTFSHDETALICEEEIYVSDELHESHYRVGRDENRGATFVQAIEADMSFLIEKGLITRVPPSEDSTFEPNAPSYWEVEFDLVIIVNGFNLRWEARWPKLPKAGEAGPHVQSVYAGDNICIVAGFRPGTA